MRMNWKTYAVIVIGVAFAVVFIDARAWANAVFTIVATVLIATAMEVSGKI